MAKGMITKRAGNWQVKLDIGIDPSTGKRKQGSKTFKYRKDAEAYLASTLNDLNRDQFLIPSKLTVGEYLEDWLNTVAKVKTSPITYINYRNKLYRHVVPLLGKLLLKDLHQGHLSKLYADIQMTNSPTTALHVHRIVHSALEHAVNNAEILFKNVAKKAVKPRKLRQEANILSIPELNRVLEASQDSVYHPVFLLLAYSGMRRSEVLGLRLRDIDFDNSMISVIKTIKQSPTKGAQLIYGETKTKRSTRPIDLSTTALLSLKGQRERLEAAAAILGINLSPDMYIFGDVTTGEPMRPQTLSQAWRRLRQKLNLPEVKLKDLRHTHASALIAAGVHPKIISERLGHTNIGITMDIYGHLMPGASRQAADQFEGLMQAEPKLVP